MSAGKFIESKYEDDEGNIYSIRVLQPTLDAKLSATNAPPSAAVDQPLFATARGSKRSYGVNARTVRLRFTGTVPTGYAANSVVSVPVLTPAIYAATNKKTTGMTYLGAAVAFVGKTAESVR